MPMELRSRGRKLSFDILAISDVDDVMSTTSGDSLSRTLSDPASLQNGATSPSPRKRKKKKTRKGKTLQNPSAISETSAINGAVNYSCTVSTVTETAVVPDLNCEDNFSVQTVTRPSGFGELRQRNVMTNGGSVDMASDESVSSKKDDNAKEEVPKIWRSANEMNSEQGMEPSGRKLEKDGTLDLKNLMAGDPNYTLPAEKSPLKYFMEEMYAGNSLRSTTTIGNDKERERVYDTIFRLPWRCELVINVGLFVCFDSFLSLLTIMPTRIIITIWRLLKSSRGLHQQICPILAALPFWLLVSLYYNKQISA